MKNDKNLWIMIAAVAAVVAAVTTVIVLIVRARQKAAQFVEPVYDCGCCDDSCCENAVECVDEQNLSAEGTATE